MKYKIKFDKVHFKKNLFFRNIGDFLSYFCVGLLLLPFETIYILFLIGDFGLLLII